MPFLQDSVHYSLKSNLITQLINVHTSTFYGDQYCFKEKLDLYVYVVLIGDLKGGAQPPPVEK